MICLLKEYFVCLSLKFVCQVCRLRLILVRWLGTTYPVESPAEGKEGKGAPVPRLEAEQGPQRQY